MFRKKKPFLSLKKSPGKKKSPPCGTPLSIFNYITSCVQFNKTFRIYNITFTESFTKNDYCVWFLKALEPNFAGTESNAFSKSIFLWSLEIFNFFLWFLFVFAIIVLFFFLISLIPSLFLPLQEEGWLMGIKESTGEKGMFPANFTRPLWNHRATNSPLLPNNAPFIVMFVVFIIV